MSKLVSRDKFNEYILKKKCLNFILQIYTEHLNFNRWLIVRVFFPTQPVIIQINVKLY